MSRRETTRRGRDKRTFKDWYDEHADDLNAQKAQRYADDPKYRNKALKRVRDKFRKDHFILDDGSRVVFLNGVPYVADKISAASARMGINNNTLRGYYHNGYLPMLYFDNVTLKLITVDQVPFIKEFVTRCETESVADVAKDMREYLLKHWRDRGESEKIISENQ